MAQVQTISHPSKNPGGKAHHMLSTEQFQSEIDYWRATVIIQKMLSKGLITESEFHKIDKLNRQSFSPLLASIMV